ncbi:hypothetical protein D3C76_1653300 [compost metagenome]
MAVDHLFKNLLGRAALAQQQLAILGAQLRQAFAEVLLGGVAQTALDGIGQVVFEHVQQGEARAVLAGELDGAAQGDVRLAAEVMGDQDVLVHDGELLSGSHFAAIGRAAL